MELKGKVVIEMPCESRVTIMPDGRVFLACREKVHIKADYMEVDSGSLCLPDNVWLYVTGENGGVAELEE